MLERGPRGVSDLNASHGDGVANIGDTIGAKEYINGIGTHGKDNLGTGCDTTVDGTGSENNILTRLYALCHIVQQNTITLSSAMATPLVAFSGGVGAWGGLVAHAVVLLRQSPGTLVSGVLFLQWWFTVSFSVFPEAAVTAKTRAPRNYAAAKIRRSSSKCLSARFQRQSAWHKSCGPQRLIRAIVCLVHPSPAWQAIVPSCVVLGEDTTSQ